MNSSSDWWRCGVVYQIYPRSFQDSNGDGIGDLAGVTSRLDYLAGLGVNALWLSPFYPSPGADFGYDVSDYVNVDPMFGDLADFDELLAGAHGRGLKVIVDFVPNHSSDQHPWFVESRSSRTNPKRDWYYWRDPKPDGSPPNNWLAAFGGPAWTLDEQTGQYYLHQFLPRQPDLNWRNPEVKAAMFDAMRFWLDRGVDGFRIDVAIALMKDPELRDNPPNPDFGRVHTMHKATGEVESQLQVRNFGHPDIHGLYREIRELLNSYDSTSSRVMIGELHIWDPKVWATYYGAALDEMHLPYNFGLLKTEWQARAIMDHVAGIEAAVPPGGWPNYVFGNHDEHRIATRIGPENARVAMMLLLTLRGTPTIYYGDELGMEDVAISPEQERDPWGLRVPGLNLGRDPGRTPMQWSSHANAGFTEPGATPWLPLESEWQTRNVDLQDADPFSMLALTKQILALRRNHPALNCGNYEAVSDDTPDCLVFRRKSNDEQFMIGLNLGGETRTIHIDASKQPECMLSTMLDRDGELEAGGIQLRPHEGVILRL